jgi:hypothetical protein
MAIDEPTRRLVRARAETRHHAEHIVARQHGGPDDDANLALACQHWKSQT